MIEPLEGMPQGTLGFRASGRVTGEEYRDILLPAMQAAVDAGEVRMVFQVGPGFEELELGALAQDAKTGLTLGLGNLRAWRRTALVTDGEWITKAFHMFAWMAPGEVKVFGHGELAEARAWVPG